MSLIVHLKNVCMQVKDREMKAQQIAILLL